MVQVRGERFRSRFEPVKAVGGPHPDGAVGGSGEPVGIDVPVFIVIEGFRDGVESVETVGGPDPDLPLRIFEDRVDPPLRQAARIVRVAPVRSERFRSRIKKVEAPERPHPEPPRDLLIEREHPHLTVGWVQIVRELLRSPVEAVEAPMGPHPELPEGILVKRVHAGTRIVRIDWIMGQVVAVIPVEPSRRSGPQKTPLVLKQEVARVVGEDRFHRNAFHR